jgi:ParB family chromosome partitioning protein
VPNPRFQGLIRAKNVAEIPLDKILRDENQPRQEFNEESLLRLAESLRTRGQWQPIRVTWDEERVAYVILLGERRWRAAKLTGMSTITAVLHEGPMDPAERLAVQIIDHARREDLKPIERARAFRRLMDQFGWTTTRAGEELGVAQGTIVRALKLLELPEAVQEKVEQGVLSPATAYEISKLEEPEQQVALADRVVDGKIRLDEVKNLVKERKARRGEKTVARRRLEIKTKSFVFTATGPVDDAAALHEAWLKVLRQLEDDQAA